MPQEHTTRAFASLPGVSLSRAPFAAGQDLSDRADFKRLDPPNAITPLRLSGGAESLSRVGDVMLTALASRLHDFTFQRVLGAEPRLVLVITKPVGSVTASVECAMRPSGADVFVEAHGYVWTPRHFWLRALCSIVFLYCAWKYFVWMSKDDARGDGVFIAFQTIMSLGVGTFAASLALFSVSLIKYLMTGRAAHLRHHATDEAMSAVNEILSAIGHSHMEVLEAFAGGAAKARRRI